jgi:hypothetical protein
MQPAKRPAWPPPGDKRPGRDSLLVFSSFDLEEAKYRSQDPLQNVRVCTYSIDAQITKMFFPATVYSPYKSVLPICCPCWHIYYFNKKKVTQDVIFARKVLKTKWLMYIRPRWHIFHIFHIFIFQYYSSMNLYMFGSFFPALAARIRVNCSFGRRNDRSTTEVSLNIFPWTMRGLDEVSLTDISRPRTAYRLLWIITTAIHRNSRHPLDRFVCIIWKRCRKIWRRRCVYKTGQMSKEFGESG